MRIEISPHTFVHAVMAVLLTMLALRLARELSTVLLLIALSLLLAGVLSHFVARLERIGIGRGLASVLALLVAVLVIGGVLALVLPAVITQTSALIDNLPEITARAQRALAPYPTIYNAIQRQIEQIRRDPSELVTGVVRVGVDVLGGVVSAVLLLTLALYFLIDAERVRSAALRLTPARYRERVARTISGVGQVVRSYFIGQAIVSSIFATYTFILLTLLDVPYPAVLAALAFVLDAIPNVGATLATVVPALVALTVSPTTALIAVVAIQVYQQVENYLISPKILGGRLRIPPIATLIAILVGARLLGVLGVFVAIPIAGMLPVLERIWITGEPRAGP
ncbi:MAG TPA: AI-2E family transporter [Longimicrobiales bacterium]